MTSKLNISDGPDKPALQWSLTNSEPDVHFRVEDDALEAQILQMKEEGADGFTFRLHGRLTSGSRRGERFDAIYNVASRSGWISLNGDKGSQYG